MVSVRLCERSHHGLHSDGIRQLWLPGGEGRRDLRTGEPRGACLQTDVRLEILISCADNEWGFNDVVVIVLVSADLSQSVLASGVHCSRPGQQPLLRQDHLQ